MKQEKTDLKAGLRRRQDSKEDSSAWRTHRPTPLRRRPLPLPILLRAAGPPPPAVARAQPPAAAPPLQEPNDRLLQLPVLRSARGPGGGGAPAPPPRGGP